MNKRIAVIVGGAAVVAALGAATPAFAAPTGNTTVTFAINAGTLDITVPAATNLGSAGTPGTSITGQMGTVTVTDTRFTLLGTWTASVTSSDFKTGGGTAPETVPASAVSYWSGPATANTGIGTPQAGQANAAAAAALSNTTALTAFRKTGIIGQNSTSWNPTLIVNLPAAAVAGTYSGTVTHSVA